MHPGALRALEFDRIVDAVCRLAQTPPGLARLARLHPSTDPHDVSARLAATAETARFLGDTSILLRAPAELDAILESLAVEGRALDPLPLVALAGFLASIDATCAGIRRARGAVPTLRAIADTAASFEQE